MKVLHLTTTLPWPPDYGGRIVAWNHIRADGRRHEVGLLSFTDSAPGPEAQRALEAVCGLVRTVVRPRGMNGPVGMLRNLFSGTALNMARYRWPVFETALREVVAAWRPDVVVAHHLHMAPYPLRVAGPVPILREHNVDSQLMKRYAAGVENPIASRLAGDQSARIRREESRLCPRFSRCLMITAHDQDMLREIAPAARTVVVPAGLPLEEYDPLPAPAAGAPPLFVSAGSLQFPPTADGVLWFAREGWPHVRAAQPGARLRIVGHCPESIRATLAALPGVEVLGRVEDVRPHLAGAHAFVVPLRAGSGVRIKILEALAWEIPVVTTRLGAEGIPAEAGRDLQFADDATGLAEALLGLYAAPALAEAARRAGRRLVENHYALDALGALTDRIYAEALAEFAPVTR